MLFTVFTPTYNRAHTLHRVYGSLKAQTLRDFEWLIVDDGSTDGTRELVSRWQAEADFPVRYLYQENAGKHVAFNRGVREARGELFLSLDSDDSCKPTALERFAFHWNAIPEGRRAGFSGVTALCEDEAGRLVGSRFPHDPTDSDSLEIRYRHKVSGEKWGFQRTEVLLAFPFPEPPERGYLSETVVWGRIARRYQTRYVNERLRVYHRGDDQITTGFAPSKAALAMLGCRVVLNEHIAWFGWAPLSFARTAVLLARFSFHARVGVAAQARTLTTATGRLLYLAAVPAGFLLYLKDARRKPSAGASGARTA